MEQQNKKVTQYFCVVADSGSKLNEIVNEKISEGYVPLGGVAFSTSVTEMNRDFGFAQAMIKKENNE